MAQPTALYADIQAAYDRLDYNPSRRYVTAQDITENMKAAILETALAIGGIHYIDTTNLSVANQRDYVLNTQYKQIKAAQYITNIGAANELVTPLDVITEKDRDFIGAISNSPIIADPYSLYLQNAPSPTPKYIIFWPEIATMRVVDTPSVSNDTFKLWVLGVPALIGPGVAYSGDAMETNAIALHMVMSANLKRKETNAADKYQAYWSAACQKVVQFRSKMRRRRQAGDGRFGLTRLRSVNGAD